jgi:hypothetical protein
MKAGALVSLASIYFISTSDGQLLDNLKRILTFRGQAGVAIEEEQATGTDLEDMSPIRFNINE